MKIYVCQAIALCPSGVQEWASCSPWGLWNCVQLCIRCTWHQCFWVKGIRSFSHSQAGVWPSKWINIFLCSHLKCLPRILLLMCCDSFKKLLLARMKVVYIFYLFISSTVSFFCIQDFCGFFVIGLYWGCYLEIST